VTKTSWDSQVEIAKRSGAAQSTVSRWLTGTVPDAESVVQLARAYGMSPVAALVAAGYLEPDEITNSGVQPRALALHEFSELELSREMLRRIEQGSGGLLEAPLDANHPAMRERAARPDVGGDSDAAVLDELPIESRRESRKRDYDKAALKDQGSKRNDDVEGSGS